MIAIQLCEAINWDGRRLPFGSVIVLEETDTAIDDHDLSVGSGLDARTFAGQVGQMLGTYGTEDAPVVVDDAKGLQGDSVVGYYTGAGLNAGAISRKAIRPPLAVRLPASCAAVSGLAPTGDRPGRKGVASAMVSGVLSGGVVILSRNKIIRHRNGLVAAHRLIAHHAVNSSG